MVSNRTASSMSITLYGVFQKCSIIPITCCRVLIPIAFLLGAISRWLSCNSLKSWPEENFVQVLPKPGRSDSGVLPVKWVPWLVERTGNSVSVVALCNM